MKIALVCTQGGHLTETLQLLDGFEGHHIFFATNHSPRDDDIRQIAPAYFTGDIGVNPIRILLTFPWALRILWREKPAVILSLGAEIALPFFFWGKVLGIKTVFIESWCRVENISRTGRLMYPLVDAFWVQWPQLLNACGPKARYKGAVISLKKARARARG
jgi:UDP-N-acetylglucosamine:LPS N-acetylglucosamine transferase